MVLFPIYLPNPVGFKHGYFYSYLTPNSDLEVILNGIAALKNAFK